MHLYISWSLVIFALISAIIKTLLIIKSFPEKETEKSEKEQATKHGESPIASHLPSNKGCILAPWLKFIAMGISSFGDMALACYGIFEKNPNHFIIGAGLFATSHIFYFLAYKIKIKNNLFNKGFLQGALSSLVFIVLLILSYFHNPQTHFMLVLALTYGVIIGTLCATVFAYKYDSKNKLAFINIIGILFFIFSDFLIGINIVGGIDFYCRGNLIWIFYPIGQFLLILDFD